MKRIFSRRICLALLAFLALMAAGCSADSVDATQCEHNRVSKPGNMTNRCGLYAAPGADVAELEVKVTLTQGRGRWSLTDPSGVVRADGPLEVDQPVDLLHVFEGPLSGWWQLEYRLEEAAGEFENPWKVSFE